MSVAVAWRSVCICAIVANCCVVCAEETTDVSREVAARSLLAQGEEYVSATRLYEALGTFERVKKDYPDTEAAGFAEFWRGLTLARLPGSQSQALTIERAIVTGRPGTVLACWAQFAIGEMLGDTLEGRTALLRVSSILPNRSDLTPLDLSRNVLADLCAKKGIDAGDVRSAAAYLGLGSDDAEAKAQVLAMAALRMGKSNGVDAAKPLLDRLRAECPDEIAEFEWATTHVATACLASPKATPESQKLAVQMLTQVCASARLRDDTSARACLALARYCKGLPNLAEAATVLRGASAKCLDTAHGADLMYELGLVLSQQGHKDEALAAMKRIVAEKPMSSQAVAARSFVDRQAVPEGGDLLALIKQAEKTYEAKPYSVPSRDKEEESLDDLSLVAARVVALAENDMPHMAFEVLDRAAARARVPATDLLVVKGEVGLCSLRAGARKGVQSREALYVLAQVVNAARATGAAEHREICNSLTSEAESWCAEGRSPSDADDYLNYAAGVCYAELGDIAGAAKRMTWIVEHSASPSLLAKARAALRVWCMGGTQGK